MTDAKKPQDSCELLKRALAAIDQLQAKLAQAEIVKHEPIAIIGIGCRFPGADGADAYWRNLIEGVDSVTEVPSWRWDVEDVFDPDPDAIGKACTKWGGFLKDVELFDAPFFGITPREAANLDPQQRQVLESSWLALEDAGIAPSSVANTRTGVYIGLSGLDYFQMLARAHGTRADSFALSGTAHSVAGGRVSYFLGAQGPNISIDTACSSSLVAVHLAVKGLRAQEADMALAGGVNITLLADASILTSRARMMSPTGRCNAFDASADGYVRSEGSAMIVLKRLSDAQRDGDRILALIRGTALNQDGRSSGLTAPHGPSQEAVMHAALQDAGLTADDIAFVEAHGTGTSLGDPIEVNALGNVFADRPRDRPLIIGSVKANIGHTEAAAGAAGLIKAVQALRHRMLPRQLHVNQLNPMINWNAIPVRVALETTPLMPRSDEPLCCGVSSFGFSGTNAHVILQEAPPVAMPDVLPHAADASTMLALSARTQEALAELAGRYADLFEAGDTPTLREVAAVVPLARSHFAERVGIVANDATEASTALRAFASGAKAMNIVSGRVRSAATPEVVFLFTGQGAQYVGMGKGLYDTEQVFRAALDLCDELARPHLAHGLIDIIFGRNGTEGLLDDTTYTQPALFALEYALAQTWRAWGVEPVAVMGHSVGEYTAACIAGVFSLEDAIRLIIARGRLMGSLPAGGAMTAVFAPENVVRAVIAETGGRISVAAVNGPTNIVISGAAEDLETIAASLETKGVELQRLNVSHAFHSALMDPILDEFEDVAASVRFDAPKITLHSNLTGARMGADGCSAAYWRRHLREAVRFSDSIAALQGDGYRVFLEIGPAPILTSMAQRSTTVEDAVYLPSLRRGRDDRRSMLEAAAHLYTVGVHFDWPTMLGPRRGHVSLPTYPFQRTRHWIEGSASTTASFTGKPSSHAMLGVKAAAPVDIYQTRLGVAEQPWTKDHRIFGFMPFPAAGFLELALAAARECDGPEAALDNVTIAEGLLLPETGAVEAQVVLGPDENGRRSVQIYSAAPDVEDARWRLHMSALIDTRGEPQSSCLPVDTQGFRAISCEAYYKRIGGLGGEYGPSFRGMQAMRRNGRELFAEVALPPGLAAGHILHPTLLDACFHPLGICMETEEAEGTSTDLFMPVGVRRFAIYRDGATAGVARVAGEPLAVGAQSVSADIALFDESGAVIAEVIGLEVRRASRTALERMMLRGGPQADWRFGIDWRASASDNAPLDLAGQNWLVFADSGGVAEAFATRMRAAGASVELVACPAVLDERHIASAVAKAAPIYRPLHGVALLWALDVPASFDDADALEAAACSANASALFALRAVADRAARLLVATRGTQQVDMEAGADLVQSSIWAFAGVVAAEHPTCGLTRIDLSASALRDDDADALCAEAAAADMEDRVAYRGGQRHVARLSLAGSPTGRRNAEIRRDGTYVLTGGLAGLGLTTARWLAQQGAGGVLLLGRRAPSEEAQANIAEMEALGTRVLTAQVDVGDTAAVASVLDDARRKIGPIRGVVHAAGVVDDAMLSEQTPERLARVMAPKVRGGWALHELTLHDPLDFFVLFSSGAALLGSPGQSNYAAANGFLDGLAHYRHARGLPALSINWGSWTDVGMASRVGADHHRRWSAMGLEMITPTSGMEMLGEMIGSGAGPQIAAVPLVRTRLPANVSPFYRELVNGQNAKVDAAPPINIMNDLLAAEPSERQAVLDRFLADQVRCALALPASQAVDRHEPLLNLGMDSLMAMEIRNRLLSAIGVRVAVADLLNGATVTDIGRMLMCDLVTEAAKQAPVTAEAGWEEGRL